MHLALCEHKIILAHQLQKAGIWWGGGCTTNLKGVIMKIRKLCTLSRMWLMSESRNRFGLGVIDLSTQTHVLIACPIQMYITDFPPLKQKGE